MHDIQVDKERLITLTSDIVSAHLGNNTVAVGQVSGLIVAVHTALANLGRAGDGSQSRPEPAVSVRASVKKDNLVCLECGKRMKMLKRHLATEHHLLPDEYRRRWDLPSNYPMVTSEYAELRSNLAKKTGLGRKPGQKRGRKKKA